LYDGKIIMIYRIEDYNMRLKSYRSYIEINDNHMKCEKLYKYFNINGDVIFSKLRGNIEKFDENIKTCEKELNNLQQKIEHDSKELQILENSLNNYTKELQILIMR
jgi:chromosome segregation ATPase